MPQPIWRGSDGCGFVPQQNAPHPSRGFAEG